MADGSSLETYANHANTLANGAPPSSSPAPNGTSTSRVLTFAGVAIVAAGVAYALVKSMLARRPADPTTERIQQLIDEANRLLKQLDEKTE
ncbi:MAG: hypothetical protein NVS2B8_05410 [Vulcanimicrobiaceae bacterium]